jgi:hypothetical protein
MLATAAWAPLALCVPLGEITTLYEDERVATSSPSNISPATAPGCSGQTTTCPRQRYSHELIRALRNDPDLEAVDPPL